MREEACAGRESEGSIARERIASLRTEMRNHSLSFPARIPAFAREHRRDVQWRVVALYFVRGWSCDELGRRYALTPRRIRQLIREWVTRAETLGYLQRIPPEAGSAKPAVRGTVERSMPHGDGVSFPPAVILHTIPSELQGQVMQPPRSSPADGPIGLLPSSRGIAC